MKIIALISLIFMSANTFVTDVTGHWKGRFMDQFDISYDFIQDGEKLSGTTTGPEGNVIPIDNGVIKGDDVSFTINVMGGDAPVTGKVSDKTMSLSIVFDGNPVAYELKKEDK